MNTLDKLDYKSTNKIKWNILLIYFAYIMFIVLGFCVHENFSDEAQAWLIARDLNLGGIFAQMKYEGHFLLWYLILYPWAQLGVTYKLVNILSALCMIVAAGLVLYKSPFSFLQKCIVLATAPMLYAFPIIAIRYALAPLFLFLIASNYEHKLDHPIRYSFLLILLGNVHVLLWGILGALCLDFLIEIVKDNVSKKAANKRHIISLAILGVGLILSLLPIMGSVSTNETLNKATSLKELLTRWGSMLVEHLKWTFLSTNNSMQLVLVMLCAAVILVYGLIYHRKPALIYLAALLFQVVVLGSLYHTVWQKSLFILVDLIFVLWIKALKKDDESTFPKGKHVFLWAARLSLVFLMILSVADGMLALRDDVFSVYSSGKEAAEFISTNSEDAVYVTLEESNTMTAICGYLPKDSNVHFYQLRQDCEYSFVTWNENEQDVLDDTLKERIDDKFDSTQEVYYIHLGSSDYAQESSNTMIDKYVNDGYLTPVFTSGESLSGEDFVIYKVNR